ncbi:MAG: glycosyltransferase family 2 protein [Treponemataceae bacterium]|nr:MAG: glycosyltransferase family 2 protein [Treponemataceae bacterium]
MPFFSIIIPVYNAEKTIEHCLNSCLNQTYKNIEIICIDDCSTDASLFVLKKYTAKDQRIRCISLESNVNLYMARKIGMQNIQGDYVLFLDSDDTFQLDACEILSNEIAKNPTDIIHFGYIKNNDRKLIFQPILPTCQDYILAFLTKNQRISPAVWSRAYSNALIKYAIQVTGDFQAFMAEDVYYSIVFYYLAKTISFIDKTLIIYSDGGGSHSEIFDSARYIAWLKSYSVIAKQIQAFITSYIPEYAEYCIDVQVRFLEDFLGRIPKNISTSSKNEIIELINTYYMPQTLFLYIEKLQKKEEKYNYYFAFDISIKQQIRKIFKLQLFVFSKSVNVISAIMRKILKHMKLCLFSQ